MDEQNEKLLQQFFSEAAQQTIDDNGFTERVMSQLPMRVKRFTRIWSACCIVIAALLFTVFHGWELLLVQMEVFLRTTIAEPPQVNPLTVVFTLFCLLMIGVYELLSYERLIR
ncbi:MAG: DUF5056 domain-containing protein [Prevotella sp.]|nr:DUF5056 domain-containing protein [Prevotella sp.]